MFITVVWKRLYLIDRLIIKIKHKMCFILFLISHNSFILSQKLTFSTQGFFVLISKLTVIILQINKNIQDK